MTARRSTRLILAPVVAVAAVVLVVVAGPSGAVLGIPVTVYWLMSAVADYQKRITIEPGRIEMAGYLGGPILIGRDEVSTCRYVKFRVRERSLETSFFEISGTGGQSINVWRYGWGSRSGDLFGALSAWLSTSRAVVDEEARRKLDDLAGRS